MATLTARLSDLAADVLFTSVRVTEVTELTPKFLKVSLGCDAFTRAHWTPGDKLQLRPRRGSLAMRTYTPINWNPDEGTTDVVAYRHGDGPAVRWFDNAVAGVDAEIFGPSKSLDLSDTVTHTVFVGDETSIGLAYALQQLNPNGVFLYEAHEPEQMSNALAALGIDADSHILRKSADRRELLDHLFEAAAIGRTGASVDIVVTGDAATVNAVRRGLKARPDLALRIKARAYWASGRTGLS
ncbi:siderophore-interacting protein [Mycolicibacterium neoaurum]|uniref:siderophore-interacting protein n=1 Tax=Mycolicibacterium neoaurum TaxID=1795 RepID=UPI00248C4EF3|nr:siderophore-interacting protein [Mycolicibacterium neoaurum]WBP92558.1 siderophore-interacting protein [Mycolicibacterium neoaurum]WBS06539.1 siderophore-interacting protein [Mycolicibacterium neoaurum]